MGVEIHPNRTWPGTDLLRSSPRERLGPASRVRQAVWDLMNTLYHRSPGFRLEGGRLGVSGLPFRRARGMQGYMLQRVAKAEEWRSEIPWNGNKQAHRLEYHLDITKGGDTSLHPKNAFRCEQNRRTQDLGPSVCAYRWISVLWCTVCGRQAVSWCVTDGAGRAELWSAWLRRVCNGGWCAEQSRVRHMVDRRSACVLILYAFTDGALFTSRQFTQKTRLGFDCRACCPGGVKLTAVRGADCCALQVLHLPSMVAVSLHSL